MDEDLKNKLIRLGCNYPELRANIRPLLDSMKNVTPSVREEPEPEPEPEPVRERNRFERLMDNANVGKKNG